MTERATEPVTEQPVPATEQADPQAAVPQPCSARRWRKSGLLWIEVADDRTWPAWHVWDDGAALVVSGPGRAATPVAAQGGPGHPAQQGHRGPAAHGPRTRPRPRARHPRVAARGRAAPRVAAQLGRRLADPLGGRVHRHRPRALRQPARVTRRVCRPRPPRAPGPHRRDDHVVAPVALGWARRGEGRAQAGPRRGEGRAHAPRRSARSCARSASDVAPVAADADPIALGP